MADAIYLLSMELFSKEFIMDPRFAEQVHKMAVFYLYLALGKLWIMLLSPFNDIQVI